MRTQPDGSYVMRATKFKVVNSRDGDSVWLAAIDSEDRVLVQFSRAALDDLIRGFLSPGPWPETARATAGAEA